MPYWKYPVPVANTGTTPSPPLYAGFTSMALAFSWAELTPILVAGRVVTVAPLIARAGVEHNRIAINDKTKQNKNLFTIPLLTVLMVPVIGPGLF
jgi:hypothetical protein